MPWRDMHLAVGRPNASLIHIGMLLSLNVGHHSSFITDANILNLFLITVCMSVLLYRYNVQKMYLSIRIT